MSKKILFIFCILSILLVPTTYAANNRASYKINQFSYSILQTNKQNSSLRIEIGLNKASNDFKVHINEAAPNQLVLELNQVEIGKIKHRISLDGTFAKRIDFSQVDNNSKAVILLPQAVAMMQYKIYTIAADKKTNKPFRIVIEIMNKGLGFNVDGVQGKTIILDPGHGGSDSGAIGPDGIMEKDVTFAVAKKVQSMLESSGAKVIMTRTDDVDVYGVNASDHQELQARVDVGRRNPTADVFLSIHANSFTSPQAHGTATYYYAKSSSDGLLAQALQDGMVESGGLSDRGVSEANFYVIKYSVMPAALVEMAFVSNPTEQDLLNSDSFQDKMAKGICKGLSAFFGQMRN